MSQMSTAAENTVQQAPGQEQPGVAGEVRLTKRVPVSNLLNVLLQLKPRSEHGHEGAENSEAQEVAAVGCDSQAGGREKPSNDCSIGERYMRNTPDRQTHQHLPQFLLR